MKRLLLISFVLMLAGPVAWADSDYYVRRAKDYIDKAEYYQRKAEGYRDDASYHLSRAKSYERDAAYYIRREDYDRARSCARSAKSEMEKYEQQMRDAASAADDAATYLDYAANALGEI